jgi:hypothetical protein
MTQQKTCTSETATHEHHNSSILAGPDLLHDPYLPPLCLLVAYALYLCFKGITDPRPLCAADFWANDNHIRKTKAKMPERQTSDDFRDVDYQMGNVPIVDAVSSILSISQPKTDEMSVHNHLIHEHLKQGFPQVILDLDYPAQTSLFVPLAQELGYKPEDIHLFVPGEKESGVWNPCHSTVGSRSIEMSSVFQANANPKDAKSDDISTSACRHFMAATLSMARFLPSGTDNILGCRAIIDFNDLHLRFREQREKLEQIDPWVFALLDQLLSAKSNKTASSIAEAVQDLFNQFCHPEILPSVTGNTSFPLRLDGRKLLIIGCTPKHQKAVVPLLMALLNRVVEENLVLERHTPLQVAINGLHKVRYPSLIDHINEVRLYGVFFNLAAPNIDVLEPQFERCELQSLFMGVGNLIWSHPFSDADLMFLSRLLEPWTDLMPRFETRSALKKQALSDYLQSKLSVTSTLHKLRRGTSIVLSNGICSADGERKPWKTKIKFDPLSVKRLRWSKQQWAAIRTKLIDASVQQPFDATLQATIRNAAKELLPELSRQGSRS